MKKILLSIMCFLLTANIALATEKTATQFVNNLVNDVVNNVLASKESKEKKTELFEKYVLAAIDLNSISRTVLAQYWRTATPEKQERFIAAFKDMAMKMSAERFNMYKGQEVKFFAERPAQGKNQVFVESSVSSETKPIQVVWRVREKNGEFKIIDIIVEGVSMTLSYRNEYTSYLQSHSMDELIERLNYQATHAAEIKEKEDAKKAKNNP